MVQALIDGLTYINIILAINKNLQSLLQDMSQEIEQSARPRFEDEHDSVSQAKFILTIMLISMMFLLIVVQY